MSRKRPAGDIAHAMAVVFATPAGNVLHGYLTSVAMSLSALKGAPGGALALNDQRGTDLAEGKRWLAIELLGAPNSIEGGNNG